MPDLRITKVNGVTNGRSDGGANEIERLRADVEETRHRLGSSLAELERRVSVTAHWRKWAEAHPVALLAMAMGAGYLVGRLGGVRRRSA